VLLLCCIGMMTKNNDNVIVHNLVAILLSVMWHLDCMPLREWREGYGDSPRLAQRKTMDGDESMTLCECGKCSFSCHSW
jgi:hypothetical protein